MGQLLSEPITTKETALIENDTLKVGASCMQGWRSTMEDAHTIILNVPTDPDACFIGVYDGHGGIKVANYLQENLHNNIFQRNEYHDGKYIEAFKQGFLETDLDMMHLPEFDEEPSGSTAVTIFLKGPMLLCANVGDSRAVGSAQNQIIPLSEDHKVTNSKERQRIMNAGGFVALNRVNGNLALTRAFGDFVYKLNTTKSFEEQIIVSVPDIKVFDRRKVKLDFILMACDGIWDVLTSEEACNFVTFRLMRGISPDLICEDLLDFCLAPDNDIKTVGTDNMTVILLCFKTARPSIANATVSNSKHPLLT